MHISIHNSAIEEEEIELDPDFLEELGLQEHEESAMSGWDEQPGTGTSHTRIRTRLYFTSESHMYGLTNALRFGMRNVDESGVARATSSGGAAAAAAAAAATASDGAGANAGAMGTGGSSTATKTKPSAPASSNASKAKDDDDDTGTLRLHTAVTPFSCESFSQFDSLPVTSTSLIFKFADDEQSEEEFEGLEVRSFRAPPSFGRRFV